MDLTVWILEKDPKQVSALKRLWSGTCGSGVSLRSFSSFEELKAASAARLPDLICGDLLMLCEKGTESIRLCRELGPVDLMVITSSRLSSSFTLAQRCGIIDYILYPYDPERLRRSILRYLKLRSSFLPAAYTTQLRIDSFLFSGPSSSRRLAASSNRPSPSGVASVLDALLHAPGGLEVKELTARLSMSRTTLLKDLDFLEAQGLIQKRPVHTGQKGRPRWIYLLGGE
ncbi:MAG: HTH domain-containing protein [Lachnospiraceae bacterium]|nr:HTH domain-containing protein [Lachnospiraceae bacterium]